MESGLFTKAHRESNSGAGCRKKKHTLSPTNYRQLFLSLHQDILRWLASVRARLRVLKPLKPRHATKVAIITEQVPRRVGTARVGIYFVPATAFPGWTALFERFTKCFLLALVSGLLWEVWFRRGETDVNANEALLSEAEARVGTAGPEAWYGRVAISLRKIAFARPPYGEANSVVRHGCSDSSTRTAR